MNQSKTTARQILGRNSANFYRVNTDKSDAPMTTTQAVAVFILTALVGVAITLMFGLAVNAWVAKAVFLHANPFEGQPW
jgi:hypothetical protein